MENNTIIWISIITLLIILIYYFNILSIFRIKSGNRWSSVAMTSDGQKVVLVGLDTKILISNDGGITFSKKYKTLSWSDVSISSSGNIILVSDIQGYLHISKDGGENWVTRLNDIRRRWTAVALSDDGVTQIACIGGGQVYISKDAGDTWNIIQDPLLFNKNRSWTDADVSKDGTYITLVATSKEKTIGGDYIYTSNSKGDNGSWNQMPFKNNWISIAMSEDGRYQTALPMGSKIYMSYDFGQTWNMRSEVDSLLWYNIKMSKDGEYQTAIAYNDGIYTFKDEDYNGVKDNVKEWLLRTSIIRNWCSIGMSADGKKQVAFIFKSDVYYVSEDYGNTWKSRKI
jgi:photosystem II stability/assembly factor-like uncharacterized protein